MKKMLIIAVPVLILSFLTPWVIYKSGESTPLPLSCESNVSLTTFWENDKNAPITINSNVVISFIDSENGVFSARGTVEKNGEVYILSRRVNFHTSPITINGIKKVTLTKETVHLVDNTPDEIWKKYFLPDQLGADFYSDVKMINDNTMYIKGFATPYHVCVIKD